MKTGRGAAALTAIVLLAACSIQEPKAADHGEAIRSVYDLKQLESTTLYTGTAAVKQIEPVNDEANQPLASPKMSYILRFEAPVQFASALAESEDPVAKPIESVYISADTHVYQAIDAQTKKLIRAEDLQAGQKIELSYFYPLTPVFLAMEVTVIE